jgi:Leucine-rich repeat (LRR) protein
LDYLRIDSNSELSLLPGALQDLQVLRTIGLTVRQRKYFNTGGDIFGGLLYLVGVQIAQEFKITGMYTALKPSAIMGLKVLTRDLSHNNLHLMQRDTFIALPMLNSLVIVESNVRKTFLGSFRHLYDLRELYLDINNIKSLEPGVFQGLTKPETLSLLNNKISTLNEGVLELCVRKPFRIRVHM